MITEDQIDHCYYVKQKFLEDVRKAFNNAKKALTEEEFYYIVYSM